MVDFDADGLFLCPKIPGALRLSSSSCSALWKRGQKANGWESAFLCRGCLIGATHANATVRIAPKQGMCCRCGATGLRLIDKRICISCYNRQRERIAGRDRRGKVPITAPWVRLVAVSVHGDVVQRMAAGAVEMALFAARVYGAPVGRACRCVLPGG